ncbi:MAG: magnesium/cobalt transporter CorA [Thermoplasmatota archaeon]
MADVDAVRASGVGLPPGSLVYRGEKPAGPVKITLLDYDASHLEEREIQQVEECFPFKDEPTITWVNIDGLHEVDILEKIGRHFDIHPLVLEDIMHTEQRPKMEDFDDYIFLIFKMFYYDPTADHLKTEQVSLLLGPNWVISFQEEPGDVFELIRERIRSAKGRIRKMGADYLAYALMDAVVDNYFLVLEKIGEAVEDIEEEVVADPDPETLQHIHRLKRGLIYLRKSVWPLREVISGLERVETDLIDKQTGIFLRDVYDHTIQVIDTVETFRDMVSGMLDVYLSSVSNKMNEVMKVLTVIATIFIPLTFIAGIYGMNFAHMPELEWQWSYPFVWLVMGCVAIVMLIYFRRKQWL